MNEDDIVWRLTLPLAVPLGSPASELKKACKATRHYGGSQDLFTRWPNLRTSAQRLTSMLTLLWPDHRGEGGCLLVNCLAAGFAAAETAMQQDRNALQAQICFIQTVVEELYACTQVSVMVKKDDYWSLHDPTINAGLEQVLRSTVVDELVWVKHTVHFGKEHVVKLIYASNVFTSAELNLAGFLG